MLQCTEKHRRRATISQRTHTNLDWKFSAIPLLNDASSDITCRTRNVRSERRLSGAKFTRSGASSQRKRQNDNNT